MREAPKEYYTWRQFDEDAKKMAAWAKDRNFSGVYGIPRGGLVIAVKLSHLMNTPLVLSREDITRRTLIVDDIIDGGGTVRRLMASLGQGFEVASIYFNKAAVDATPSFFAREKKRWVIFPWETEETSRYDGTV
ncbi:MAG: hypothetical protein HY434_00970 [Candidatus Liptonbacteria bacterium]|nr:hypothetical protein [Candidatus Liptonbacteria bacterium]